MQQFALLYVMEKAEKVDIELLIKKKIEKKQNKQKQRNKRTWLKKKIPKTIITKKEKRIYSLPSVQK